MAAARSVLEALLARVQKRANEPRPSSVVSLAAQKGDAASLQTRPPVRDELSDDDIEEYDEELIEIIDDAEVIPQAAAMARAIEPAAFGASLDRRPAAGAKPAVASAPVASAAATAPRTAARPVSAAELARGESVAARPIAATEVARAQGARRELRSSPFVELLDASLQLGR